MTPLVSILIPAFNAEKWIRDCVESALAQTWSRREIIIVDDGSTDSTLEIARSFRSPKVEVVSQENQGASAARNRALTLAQGEYIQWLDADDLLAVDKIARQMADAQPGHSSLLLLSSAWGRFHHRPERARFIPSALWQDLDPVEWLFRKVNDNLWMAIETWLVSRRLTELAGPWDERLSLGDDGEYFCRVLSRSTGVRFIADARVFCRRGNPGSLSHFSGPIASKQDSLFISLSAHIRALRSMEDSARTRAACLRLLQRWLIHFYPERPDIVERMHGMAGELGGRLQPPSLNWKYDWIKNALGWSFAKKVERKVRCVKTLIRRWREPLGAVGEYRDL